MKRTLFSVLIIFTTLWMVAGCQNGIAGENTNAATPAITPTRSATGTATPTVIAPQLQVTSALLQDAQIEFWYPWTGETAAIVKNMIDEFNQTNEWGVFVIGENYPGEQALFEAFNSVDKHSDLPDLVAAPLPQILYWQQEGVNFLDVSSYLQSDIWGYSSQERSGLISSVWQKEVVDGYRWGVPAYATMHLVFYNQTWAQHLGFEMPPQSGEEFRNQACTAAIANNGDSFQENDGTGGWIIDETPETIAAWLYAFGQQLEPENINAANTFSDPAAEKALTFLKDLAADGCAWWALEPTQDDYLSDRYALFYSGSLEDVLEQEYSIQWLASSDEWTVLPYIGTDQEIVLLSGESYGILVNSIEEQMAAWIFTIWMNLPENHQRIVKASGSLPLSQAEIDLLAVYGNDHPNWAKALDLLDVSGNLPRTSAWIAEKLVLPDALWQALQPTAAGQDIAGILARLDGMITELISNDQ
jgi:multiple sugar transport system substrate-binding protein